MEVVAGVASVAGILSLLGESLNGTRKLRDFFVDVSSASTSITNLLEDINSLLQAIESIKDLIEKSCSKFKDSTVELLRVRLEEYTKDICRWFKTAKALHLPSGNRTKIWLKKLWIAVNIKSVNEIRIELERHRQTITLSLSILGRTIDASTAAGVKELGLKVSHGTTASLSKIEKQNDMLQRIESYSQTGMQSSAASVRSLQTIATSLSRLEAMACSAERSSRHESIDNGEDRIDETNFKRSSSDEIEYQSRRSSSGSAVAKKSSYASLRKSAVGVGPPTIHEEAMGSSISSEGDSPLNLPYSMRRHQRRMRRIRRIRRMRSNPEGFENREISLGTDSDVDRWRADEPHSHVASDAPGRLSCILSQDRCATHIWDALSEQHPDVVIEYIALARKARILQNKLDTLCLLNLGSNVNISMTSRLEVDASQIERDTMQGSLQEVLHQLRIARIRCVSEGYSLYGFDKRLRPPISNDHPGSFWDQLNEPDENQARNRYLVKMCDSDDSVYGDWSDKYDRINHWMLHCLRSDDTQTQLHRFMLAEPPPDDECWARQVLDHWFIDGAVGGFVEIAHSAGAVDSREISQLERPISDPGPDIRRNDELDEATIFLSGILSF